MQYWPRKRAKRSIARVRAHNEKAREKGPVGFAAYKAGMTHITVVDNRKNATTRGEEIAIPVTILEAPNLTVYGMRVYGIDEDENYRVLAERTTKAPKSLQRSGPYAKKAEDKTLTTDGALFVRLLVATQPEKTGLAKKRADLFELALAGSLDDQLTTANELLGKEISVHDALGELDIVDAHAVTKGKGTQGPVKRFGVTLTSHKSEKARRGPGNLGAFTASRTYRVAHAGQMGYHQRTDHNKQILAILEPGSLEIQGGIVRYGNPKSTILLIKGSVPGPKKRLIRLTPHLRSCDDRFDEKPEIVELSTRSQQ